MSPFMVCKPTMSAMEADKTGKYVLFLSEHAFLFNIATNKTMMVTEPSSLHDKLTYTMPDMHNKR